MEKPICSLIGKDGNIFNLIGIASKCLRSNGMVNEAIEMTTKVFEASSYEMALCIIGDYVEIV